MNNRQLYENIMKSISKEIKKSLNEMNLSHNYDEQQLSRQYDDPLTIFILPSGEEVFMHDNICNMLNRILKCIKKYCCGKLSICSSASLKSNKMYTINSTNQIDGIAKAVKYVCLDEDGDYDEFLQLAKDMYDKYPNARINCLLLEEFDNVKIYDELNRLIDRNDLEENIIVRII